MLLAAGLWLSACGSGSGGGAKLALGTEAVVSQGPDAKITFTDWATK